MRCCVNRLRLFFLMLSLLLVVSATKAAGIVVHDPQIVVNDDGYSVSADFDINFNSRLEDVVNKGVVLHFALDFELTRSRWYWFDERVVRRHREMQMSYHALTRQYRLTTGSLYQNFDTLDEALRVMSRLRNWDVFEKNEVKPEETYQAGLRLRLDLTQMPKTFQVGAMANRDWSLSTEWVRWILIPKDVHKAEIAAPSLLTVPGVLPPPFSLPHSGALMPTAGEPK